MAIKWTRFDAYLWRQMYEQGMTIEEIALQVKANVVTVRDKLHEVNCKMRSPGGGQKKRTTDGIKGKTLPAIKRAPSQGLARRRRPRYHP